MLQFMLIGFGVLILLGITSVYSDHEEQQDKAKEMQPNIHYHH